MIVPVPSFPPVVGESGGARIVRIVRAYAGCSLSVRRANLGALIARGVDEPEAVVGIETNCAMFALGVLTAAGCQHPLLQKKYVNEMAFAWLVQIGNDLGAWRLPAVSELIPTGAAIWYEIVGENDDHVEFVTEPPDEHGGGGRPNNEITIGRGDYHVSWSRPIHRWLDPEALGLPDAMAVGGDDPTEAPTRPELPPAPSVAPPADPDATKKP